MSLSRREFVKSSVVASGMGTLASVGTAFAIPKGVHSGANETLRIGLIGCGGRGTDAAIDALAADPESEVVALGDTFQDRAELCLQNLKRDELYGHRVTATRDQLFYGFENYVNVIDLCDVVLLAAPPHFRPLHLTYAVEKGKHAFVEKPIAVDAPGIREVMEACRHAKDKSLSIVSGLCWRYDLGVQETIRKVIEENMIGDIVAIESSYNSGTLWHRGKNPQWSGMERQIRNWIYYTWLSGDHIIEQAVHSLDKTAWLLGDIHPVSAMGMGGRQQRVGRKWGNVYDHFAIFFEYPTGQRVFFTCRQQDNTTTRVDERVLGTNGQAEVLRHHITTSTGDSWRYRGPKPSMYRMQHQELFKSIRKGQPINDGHFMCNSTMIGIMGRMAAYSGKTLTWNECLNSEEELTPPKYDWIDLPDPEVAIPGQ